MLHHPLDALSLGNLGRLEVLRTEASCSTEWAFRSNEYFVYSNRLCLDAYSVGLTHRGSSGGRCNPVCQRACLIVVDGTFLIILEIAFDEVSAVTTALGLAQMICKPPLTSGVRILAGSG